MQAGRQRILGIDPGSRICGVAVIELDGNSETALYFHSIHGNSRHTEQRLYEIFSQIDAVIEKYQPDSAAIETVFMHKNVAGALKLGQARGAALVACAKHNLSIHEYNPRQIKQAITGHGAAGKQQMQLLIRNHFNLTSTPPPDAADALAIALTHRYHAKWKQRTQQAMEQK